jgi:membrane protease YdiL (CAAX protease family)
MRKAPSPLIGVLAAVGYVALVAGLWAVLGLDYETVSDTSGNILKGIVLPIGLGAVYLICLTSWLGWWRPAIREERRVAPRWTLVVPGLMLLGALLNIVSIDYGAVELSWIAVLAVGVALVGFSEELVTRGLALVGFRARFYEVGSWLLTSVLFGLIHGLNLFFGQDLVATIRQIVTAFVLASALYVARLSTGTLVTAMVIHALWDFGALGFSGSDAASTPFSVVGGLLLYPTMIAGVVAAVVTARRVDRGVDVVATAPANA